MTKRAAGRVFRVLRGFKRLGGTSYHESNKSPAKSKSQRKFLYNYVVIKYVQ